MLRRLHHMTPSLLRKCTEIADLETSTRFERIKQNIKQQTKISREHLTPEIALHLVTPECNLFNAPITADSTQIFENDPFWGFYWPGGQALSRYILDKHSVVAGRSVLDVGSGCGASSLAAVLSGAKYTVANDIDEAAACAVQLNAALNKVAPERVKICSNDVIGSAVTEEVILLGDVFYDEEFAAILLPWLQRLEKEGKLILIGDPGRHGLTTGDRLSFMQKLVTYELTENCCIENNGFKFVHVWRFKKQ